MEYRLALVVLLVAAVAVVVIAADLSQISGETNVIILMVSLATGGIRIELSIRSECVDPVVVEDGEALNSGVSSKYEILGMQISRWYSLSGACVNGTAD